VITVIAGTAIRIINTFYNFKGEQQDPQIVRFKIYDRRYTLLEDFTLTDGNKLEEGKYFYDYITPTEPNQRFIVEFYGEIAGNPTIERQQIYTTFLR
jgi:hypothetical protein